MVDFLEWKTSFLYVERLFEVRELLDKRADRSGFFPWWITFIFESIRALGARNLDQGGRMDF